MLPYPFPTAVQTAMGTRYTSINWKAANNSSNKRSSNSTTGSEITKVPTADTVHTADTADTAATSPKPSPSAPKPASKLKTMASRWNLARSKIIGLGKKSVSPLVSPKTPEQRMDLSDTSASVYSNDEPLIAASSPLSPEQRYEPLVLSRRPPSPRRRETHRNTMDQIERELNDFAQYERSQAVSRQKEKAFGDEVEVGRQSPEDWPLRNPWAQQSRGDEPETDMNKPAPDAVLPAPRQRKPHSGSLNHEPTIQEDVTEQCPGLSADASSGEYRGLDVPRQVDQSQYRQSMLIEQARCDNHWSPEELIDNYSQGWEPGYGSPQHEPLDLREQALIDTRDSMGYGKEAGFFQERYATFPESRSPSIYSTSETRPTTPERSMSDGLPPSLLPPGATTHHISPPLSSSLPSPGTSISSCSGPPNAHEPQRPLSPWLDALCASPLPEPEPEPRVRSLPEATRSVRQPRVSSLPPVRRSKEVYRLRAGTARSSNASSVLEQARPARMSGGTVGPSGVMLGEIPVQRWLDGVWRPPANVMYSIRDPRMRPPNYFSWEPQACGGWL